MMQDWANLLDPFEQGQVQFAHRIANAVANPRGN